MQSSISNQFEQFCRPSDEKQRRWPESRTLQLRPDYSSRLPSQKGIQRRFSKVLQKNETYPEQNARIYSRHEDKKLQSQAEQMMREHERKMHVSKDLKDYYADTTMRSAEKQQMLDTLSRGYEIFKDLSINEDKPKPPRRLDPLQTINKTIDLQQKSKKDHPTHPTRSSKLDKSQLQHLKQTRQRDIHSTNKKLDNKNIQKDGKLMPLRLLLSNKVRSKLVHDLLTEDKQKMKQNISKIISGTTDEEWVNEFNDIKGNIRETEMSEKQRHNHQLISRSIYTNAYYQYLALNRDEREEFRRKENQMRT